MGTDWRTQPRESFQRSYTFSLELLNFPGMVYSMMPPLADGWELDQDERAWMAWLNGNTQNVVTTYLIMEHGGARHPRDWKKAVDFVDKHFKALEWDTDRRHQKAKFGQATEQWFMDYGYHPAEQWAAASTSGQIAFKHAMSHPFMGRISAWSFMEFARILLPFIPDVDGWYLGESSSRSHRNALAKLYGFDDAWSWDKEQADLPEILGIMGDLHDLAEDLLYEAQRRNSVPATCWQCDGRGCGSCRDIGQWMDTHPHVSRLTMESALCTWKSWHKPDRRYPNVYADMMYRRIRKAEARMGYDLQVLWDIRRNTLPRWARLEDNPGDLGLHPTKQNWYRENGEVHYLHHIFDDMQPSGYEELVQHGEFAPRKDPKW